MRSNIRAQAAQYAVSTFPIGGSIISIVMWYSSFLPQLGHVSSGAADMATLERRTRRVVSDRNVADRRSTDGMDGFRQS